MPSGLRQQDEDRFGFRVEPPVGDRGGDRVAMGGLHDAGAVGELVNGRGQHQGGGAAVRGGQLAGAVEEFEAAEQRVVAALSRGAGVTFAVRALVGFGEGVEQGLEVFGGLAGQFAGDAARTRPGGGAGSGCGAGVRLRCHGNAPS